ncbi:hypothetical protein GCM10023335_23770 [Streptomyces siamensis]|uniref:Uncharacterized protein n=1 Tax=Streptomyces siamensis TaxID=1274986 RepID=A0ABP9IRR8_9ACTN
MRPGAVSGDRRTCMALTWLDVRARRLPLTEVFRRVHATGPAATSRCGPRENGSYAIRPPVPNSVTFGT